MTLAEARPISQIDEDRHERFVAQSCGFPPSYYPYTLRHKQSDVIRHLTEGSDATGACEIVARWRKREFEKARDAKIKARDAKIREAVRKLEERRKAQLRKETLENLQVVAGRLRGIKLMESYAIRLEQKRVRRAQEEHKREQMKTRHKRTRTLLDRLRDEIQFLKKNPGASQDYYDYLQRELVNEGKRL